MAHSVILRLGEPKHPRATRRAPTELVASANPLAVILSGVEGSPAAAASSFETMTLRCCQPAAVRQCGKRSLCSQRDSSMRSE